MYILSNWHNIPEHINPVALMIGPVSVHWYGIMYAIAFYVVYSLVLYRIRTEKINYSKEVVTDFIFWGILGIMVGGRLGYVLFYNLPYFIQHPLNITSPLDYSNGFHYVGFFGMSYHGALLGFVLTIIIFCKKRAIDFWRFVDLFIPAIPLGYTFGRLGNFINGELYGRATTAPWGMYFPLDQLHQLRHPSQLYEAFFEGIFLFLLLWSIRRRSPYPGFLCGLYLIGYGLVRFSIEFFREPDPQLGFVLGPFTLGQIFCALMAISGFFILENRNKKCLVN
jgi:phosphatidylglycerol:prolipoprotein diacylglycerol transferase